MIPCLPRNVSQALAYKSVRQLSTSTTRPEGFVMLDSLVLWRVQLSNTDSSSPSLVSV